MNQPKRDMIGPAVPTGPDGEWHFYQRGLDIMRRRGPDGSWEYRAMTDEEHRQYIADQWA